MLMQRPRPQACCVQIILAVNKNRNLGIFQASIHESVDS